MDELPKITPDPSDIPKPRTEKERFPLNVFANCIGADGFNIMGCPVRITKKRNTNDDDHSDDNNKRSNNVRSDGINAAASGFGKPMRLSRERLEAFLAMTQEQCSTQNSRSILGAITWANGTVLIPIAEEGDDLTKIAMAGGGGLLFNTTTQPQENTPSKNLTNASGSFNKGATSSFSQNNIRKPSASTSLPPPFVFHQPQKSSVLSKQNNTINNTNNNNYANDGDDSSHVSSPTEQMNITESEFPHHSTTMTDTGTNMNSAHSSDYGLAEAVAIAAATRGLNPMSAQAAALRAAAIQRREQRLKKRKEQDILSRVIERSERFGLAGLDVATQAVVQQTLARSRGCTPPPPAAISAVAKFSSRSSPQHNILILQQNSLNNNINNSNTTNAAAKKNSKTMGNKDSTEDVCGDGNDESSSTTTTTSSSQQPASSMPDLQSGSTSEMGGARKSSTPTTNPVVVVAIQQNTPISSPSGETHNNKKSQFPSSQGNSSNALPPPPAFTSTTSKDRPRIGSIATSAFSPKNNAASPQQQQKQSSPSIQQQQQGSPKANANSKNHADPNNIHANNSNGNDDNDDDDDDESNHHHGGSSSHKQGKDPTAVAVPAAAPRGQGLSESDLRRLYKEEQRLMKNKILVVDFGPKGRGIRSTAIINPGELIWRCRPHLGVLYNDFMTEHCAHCFRPSLENRTVKSSSSQSQHVCLATTEFLVTCPYCESFALCNDCGGKPSLSRADGTNQQHPSSTVSFLWRRHLDWCKWLRTLPESVRKGDTDYLRFLLEYASRVQAGDIEVVESISTLCALEDSQSQDVKTFCESFSRLVATTFGPKGLTVSQAALREALLRIKCNALGFPFTREATIGWAVHGTVCMLNHSCEPNAALTQSPLGEMEIRAIRPINPSEEITISYVHVPDYPEKGERRKHLLTQYRFLCRCTLCERQK